MTIGKSSLYLIDWETCVGSHAPNQEPQGIWRNLEVKKWSPLGVLKEAATIPRLEETLATRLGQERTPDWDESGGHHNEKRIAGWSFNARKSTTLQAYWRWPIRDSSSLRLHQRFCDQSSTKVILSTLQIKRVQFNARDGWACRRPF